MIITQFVDILIDTIFPPRCPLCDKVVERSYKGELCDDCRKKVEPLNDVVCMKCGRHIEDVRTQYCKSCKKRKHAFTQGKVLYKYEGNMRDSIRRFKYSNRREYSEFYGRMAADRYGSWIENHQIDLIIPVPMHIRKRRFRGYNQAELFARMLAEKMSIPCEGVVTRVKATKAQAGMNEIERKNNLQNAFKLNSDIVKYKKILLVDDIYTTGSTADEISRLLIQNQADSVYILCIAAGEG